MIKKDLIYFRLIEVSTEKGTENVCNNAPRIDAVFRPFLSDILINRKNKKIHFLIQLFEY